MIIRTDHRSLRLFYSNCRHMSSAHFLQPVFFAPWRIAACSG
jgi:hypothetical protein